MQLDTFLDVAWGAISPSYLNELAKDSKVVVAPDSVHGNPGGWDIEFFVDAFQIPCDGVGMKSRLETIADKFFSKIKKTYMG